MFSTALRSLASPFLDFIYPPVCFTCNRLMENADDRICPECRSEFKVLTESTPVWNELRRKFSEGGSIDDFTSCYLFEKEGRLQQAVHSLKYQGMHSVGVLLGREIGARISRANSLKQANYVVPVPLHKLKHRERGYNQSAYLGKGISETTGIALASHLLQRTRYTETQTKLHIDDRRKNVSDAFRVNPKYLSLISGNSFILVDDIITTGSTITECGKVLKANGATRVYAASVGLAE